METAPTVFQILADAVPIALQTLAACVVIVLIVAYVAGRQVQKQGLVPSERPTVGGLIELLFDGIAGLMRDVIGPTWPRYVPLVGTLGLFILISNLMRQIPGFDGPTGYVEANLSWAIMSFAVAEYAAFKHQGAVTYLKHLLGPVIWLWPIMFIVEIFSHLARMMSLTIRLTGNMFADHTLIGVFLSLPVVSLFTPWVFAGLGVFVAFLQAFIFTFLTIIYIGLALEDAHH